MKLGKIYIVRVRGSEEINRSGPPSSEGIPVNVAKCITRSSHPNDIGLFVGLFVGSRLFEAENLDAQRNLFRPSTSYSFPTTGNLISAPSVACTESARLLTKNKGCLLLNKQYIILSTT